MDYGSFLYGSSCKTHLAKLDKLQNQAMRVIGGYIKSTPIHAMEVDLHLQPLEIRRNYLAGKFILKIRSFINNPVKQVLDELYELRDSEYWRAKPPPLLATLHHNLRTTTVHSSFQLEMFSLSTWVTNIDLNDIIKFIGPMIRAKRNYKRVEITSICQNILSHYDEFYRIYTDGSRDMCGNVGAAFYDDIDGSNLKIKVNSHVSIMHAELIAIAEALSYVGSINHNKFVILTDSKSALQHLCRCTSTLRGVSIAYDIIRTILELVSQSKVVVLQWIPSHVGIHGNDVADKLAKEGYSDGVDCNILPSHSECLWSVRDICRNLWKVYFDQRSQEKGIWFKTIQPQPMNSPWINDSRLCREDLVLLLRLRVGHIPLNKFAHLMGKVASPLCSVCMKVEDVYHILMECVRNKDSRRGILDGSAIGQCNSYLSVPTGVRTKNILDLVKCGLTKR